MTNRDLFALCWGNLKRRKTRTALSVIGVIIGVFAIVVMVSIGFGLSESFRQQMESYGNLHMIEVYNLGCGQSQDGQSYELDDKTITDLGEINGVTAATPVLSSYLTIGAGHYVTSSNVMGMRIDFMEHLGLEVESGRMLNATDKNALVFGKEITYQFYDPRKQQTYNWQSQEAAVDVLQEKIVLTGDWNYMTSEEGTGEVQYEQFEATAVGVLSAENSEEAYTVYMDLDSLRDIIDKNTRAEGGQVSNRRTYEEARLYVDDVDLVTDICDTIRETYNFSTYSLTDQIAQMQQTLVMIELVLGGIGAISLLVAAIGIANTMVMSVYERTREIGVMKVIGASLTDIRKMFLYEAGMIGLIGGGIGLILSFIMSHLMNTVLLPFFQEIMGNGGSVISVIPWWVAVGALVFATLVGVISGVVPANRAMHLSVLESLKND